MTRTEITNLKARVEELTKSKTDFEERHEAVKSHREHTEVLQVELEQQLITKNKDMVGKDVEIAELKRCLRESEKALEAEKQKAESLETDHEAEKLKSEFAEEPRKVTQAALYVAQDNYAEVQATVEPFVNNLEWLQQFYFFGKVANSVLNSIELDRVLVALTVASRHVGYREGYTECASHVEAGLHVQWGTRHCSVNEGAEKGLQDAEENYDNHSLPVMDLVSDALQHDDYVTRLKEIFEASETQELFDDDGDDAGDGNAE
ncbi:hypothetical protein HanRHA438_Chr11g0510381 [Helianthus annuus]|uniref:Uncharacterized protein n=1 Tax=Helianthus annuus TaxID=4232 RepID=A0A9K3N0J5_HELAN|nr:hypothetical protein HanXRQr2_Chr11g0497731 [Helianthus annuus]KAJ0502060.1 hypothetical protein HanHA300_Chr11g0408341 [Helianthus annuus]KAJ0510023.1 hypothetical protein HanIR_Chr11g0535901 [Helianthus annuus]KAJ0517984.1 hypothetical protein HanHA89_Chr11g0432041 [Helianthus annuus]KAJ0686004.1 hypothetical protein HanLR1_Chr11g0409581 [Helianthus annuus]